MDCLFCRIAAGAVPVPALYQDEQVYAFLDIAPQAPVHFLVIPKLHVQSLAHTAREHTALLGHMLAVAAELAAREGLLDGFRTVINSGEDGGQTIDHLHLHVLGGRPMGWPPG
ncbi:histidine triad nucleotide-binding protein [Acidipila sp. EB88]|uniref:histidine triad nucleotide-binding protein n=1 Tax=Acidipila sp. EB88 TaxID=2305226 RepID=UPI000F5F1074|nr:histidine triad nucleotide-binding protein [Acidipila sp. EB88]RRA49994.1 histidine triad nucleotide-binding protein [Acidipila sp. EB88]